MYILDKDRATKILISEHHSQSKVEFILKNFPPIDDKFASAIEQWMNGQAIPEIEVDGILLSEVMEKRHTHLLETIWDMNKLLDPTMLPKSHEQWKRILTTPIYYE
jgi:hypothetical protein